VAAEKEPQTSGRSSRLGRSARRSTNSPLPIESPPATNLKICLTPNGTADRSATNFDRKIFEGKNFVCRRLFFGIFRVSLVYFFEQNLFEKITRSPIFSACVACSSKISFDLRSPEIFEELENLYPMFLHSFRVPASTFEIENFDIPNFLRKLLLISPNQIHTP
jgi:hypothetical protein